MNFFPRIFFRRVVTALFVLLLAPAVRAQLSAPVETPAAGARMPALSPDGKKLAFVYQGDVWVSDSGGGRAYPVTDHVELDAYPIFSPDGKWLAFSSTRNGNWDIFVVPVTGGAARQMTFSSNGEIATDWAPDGKSLLYSSAYDSPNSTLYSLDVASLRFRKVTEDYETLANASCSSDGKRLVFQRDGFPWTRPRYHGSAGAQVWTLDLATGKRQTIVDNSRQNLWPHFLPDGKSVVAVTVSEDTPNAQWLNKPPLSFVDNAARTPNLYLFPVSGKPRPLTHFVGGSVRCPAVARQSGDIAFEQEHDLYFLKSGTETPVKLKLLCGAGEKQNNAAREVLTSGVTEAEISPDGKTFGFVLKGDLFTIPVEKPKTRNADDATRLTDYPGDDSDFNWSKDGKTVYFVSDRTFSNRIYAEDVTTKKVRALWTGKADASHPQVSPDGRWVGFWVAGPVGTESGGLYVTPAAGNGTPKKIVAVPAAVQGEFSWSPDMKWLAFTRRNAESNGVNLWITPADGTGTPVNVTKLNAEHRSPQWSPDGKYLFFVSDRDGDGLYVLPLQNEDTPVDELEVKFEKPTKPVSVAIDFQDTEQRIRKIVAQPINSDLTVTDDGQIFFVSAGDAYSASYDGKEVKKVTTGGDVSNLRPSSDGKTLFYYKGGGLYKVAAIPGSAPSNITFSAVRERDVRAERQAAFVQLWRTYNTRYYDGNFHGRDWDKIRARYEPLLAAVATRDEFSTLLNMMIGEIESSHAEVSAAPAPTPSPVTSNLGIVFDDSYVGPGIRVRSVPKRAPGSYTETRIKPGDYILSVDGTDVTLDENFFKTLNDKGDRDFTLLVNTSPSKDGARTVKYKALSGGEWSDIFYRNRVERLRKEVDQLSNGTLAYVHIAGMGGNNQVQFDKELYQYAEGKKGVVIDVRFNGGGNISDTLINWLGTKPYGTYYPRDGYPDPAPTRGWNKPVIVLMNDRSFSNAEMFPYGMRADGIAKLVGVPTPGYVIWTGGLNLVDGTRARLPGSGVYRRDGSPMENMGEEPDVLVPMSNEEWLTDKDPQLEKAVQMLMHGK